MQTASGDDPVAFLQLPEHRAALALLHLLRTDENEIEYRKQDDIKEHVTGNPCTLLQDGHEEHRTTSRSQLTTSSGIRRAHRGAMLRIGPRRSRRALPP